MQLPFGWKRNQRLEELMSVERYLDRQLTPVKPRPEFVERLGGQLASAKLEKKGLSPIVQYAILGAAGVFSGLIILVTGIRATVTILGALGALRLIKQHSAQKSASTTAQPVA